MMSAVETSYSMLLNKYALCIRYIGHCLFFHGYFEHFFVISSYSKLFFWYLTRAIATQSKISVVNEGYIRFMTLYARLNILHIFSFTSHIGLCEELVRMVFCPIQIFC